MKKIILALSVLIFVCFSAQAQTNVIGGVFTNTTWTLANSPYVLTGSVVVFPNVTLTIEPGVEVRIEEKSSNVSLQIYLELRGKLVAKGTLANPISFIPNTTPSVGTDYIWQGIFVKTAQGGSIDMDYFIFNNSYYGINYDDVLLDTLTFNHCKFNFNNYVLAINTNVILNNCHFINNGVPHSLIYVYGSVTARDCIYKNNYACMAFIANGVDVSGTTFENNQSCFLQISGKFKNCIFKNNISVFQENGTLEIDSSEFRNNQIGINAFGVGSVKHTLFTGNGLGLSVSANSIIQNNNISDNQVGLGLEGVFTTGMILPLIKGNKICNNTLYNLENKSDYNLSLDSNCFCLNDSVSIDAKIYDGYDDITRGLINFAIYDSSCTDIIQRVIKIQIGQNTSASFIRREVSVSPNPFQDKITINGMGNEICTWVVYDIAGKKVAELKSDNNKLELDLSFLEKGAYILKSDYYLPAKLLKY
jgi:hypothetical protein